MSCFWPLTATGETLRAGHPGPAASQPNVDEIRRNLAGTVSTGRAALKDRMTGYLVAAGIDRALTQSLTLGLKLQWKSFDEFESDAYQGVLLRSHAPNLRLGGGEPVHA